MESKTKVVAIDSIKVSERVWRASERREDAIKSSRLDERRQRGEERADSGVDR